MISILALIFVLLLLVKLVIFLIFPNRVFKFMKKFYVTIADYCLVIQGILMVLAIAVGAVLTMLVGFYTVVATGWFWTIVYTIALLPVITDAAKKDQLKDMLFSPTVKTQLLAACVFVICLCILTIGVFL